ncbi:orotidine-5'-phosphate decarboxylase [Herbiconiux sp. L3-i23]|uniref:orotidine-5'-phosphate decarboxylase n=1 Tax=Herbiconiux sp. L3-i23 TaxID=2905871 RepID=UPI00206E2DD6|nr:orotidine-5'-phosphate decarboxylase [Herbiconiux sp. L3-i23]BDI22778.1 orotidine 5'-phosphate decarboxylase [Herbiconiux sp. L3-i23]
MTDPVTAAFGDRLAEAIALHGPLCVGIDPHEYLLDEWALPSTAIGAHDFGMRVLDACVGEVAIIKPQVAFYERFGSAGYRALEDLFAAARSAGLLVLADAKRGDLGSTLAAYATAWLQPGSPLEADAVTVAPYLGFGSLEVVLETARIHGKGAFVLSATSNPEAAELQTSAVRRGSTEGSTVAGSIAELVARHDAETYHGDRLGSIGVVLGATVDFADLGVDLELLAEAPGVPVLAPGFGHQGARVEDIKTLFGPSAPNTLVAESRSILAAGPSGIVAAVRQQKQQVMEAVA